MADMQNLFFMNLQMGITAVPVILVVFLVRWGICRAPKKYSYALWAAAGMRLVFPFSVSSVFSLFNLNIFQRAGMGKNIIQPVMEDMAGWQAAGAVENGQKLSGAVGSVGIPHIQPQVDAVFADKVLWVGAAVWITGILICLLYFIVCWVRIKRRVRKAVCWKDNIWECDAVDSPFVMGVFCPKIYIPFHLEGMERKMLLLHETCHIRRRDYLVKLFAFGLLAVYWYYPFVWAAYIAMMKDMEMSCDEWVLEWLGADRKKQYSSLLLDFAEGDHEGTVSGILGFGENVTKSRIKNILNFRHFGRWKAAALAVLCMAVVVFLATNGVEKKAYDSYVLQASVSEEEEMFLPGLGLDREEETFSFGFDLLSSYLSCGTYEIEDDVLTAVTDDGMYHYRFKVIDENTLEFMQEGSSEVKLINEDMGIAVKDGAIFKKRDTIQPAEKF